MEISFKRLGNPYSSKPPITLRTKGHEVYIESSSPVSSQESQEIVRSFFRENAKSQKHNNENKIALDTSQNDVFILRGESAHSARVSKDSYENLGRDSEKEHKLTRILLQPKKAKKQAAIYFDATSMKGKKLSVVNVDKSQKGRVKIKIRALDTIA